MKNWFQITALAANHAEIIIYDEIGLWGISASDFITQLRSLGDVTHIDLRINSPGGDVYDGHAIYNLLRSHNAHVTAYVDGIAASIASIIMLAADEIVMPDNALVMIHDPSAGVWGNPEDLRKAADVLDKLREILITAYVSRTGEDRTTVAEWMTNETWFTAAEALESGLADTVTEATKAAAVYDARKFSNAPRAALQNLMSPGSRSSREENQREKGENAMTLEEIKAQLQLAGDKNTALQSKHDAMSSDLQTATASLATATATIDANADMVAAGTAYKNKLVADVVQARRNLKLVDDTPEASTAAKAFVASWPLAQIETEAKSLSALTSNPAASALITDPTTDPVADGEVASFRNQSKEG